MRPFISFILLRGVYLVFSGILTLGLFACTVSTPVTTLQPTPAASPIPTATPTITPSPVPTEPVPAVVLVAPVEADPVLSSALQSLLEDLAAQAGLEFRSVPSLSPADLDVSIPVVVALPPGAGMAELVAAAPQTQFLAIGIPGLEEAPNLTVLGEQSGRADLAAFLAGYLAAAVTEDWRVAVMSAAGTVTGQAAKHGFTNGVTYFCGLCRPAYPPFPVPGYPLAVEVAPGASEADWQAAIADLQTWQVQTVFVDPGIADEALLSFLAESGFNLISTGPIPAGLRSNWVASIGTGDPVNAVQEVWPDLIQGIAGGRLALPLSMTDMNEDLFSPGRQRLVESFLADLVAGYIDTGVDPATGEIR